MEINYIVNVNNSDQVCWKRHYFLGWANDVLQHCCKL